MFNLNNPFGKKIEVKEVSREEFNELRAAKLAERMSEREDSKEPIQPLKTSMQEGVAGTGLIKGIEFGPDEITVGISDDDYTAIRVSVPTIYPPINSYIGNKMNFQEIHEYNQAQELYFSNSSKVLLAERVNFLLSDIIEEVRLTLEALSSEMRKEAKAINEKAGRDCRECGRDESCSSCIANKYINASLNFRSTRTVIQLLPQIIDMDFYNTIKNNGGIEANKELIQVTSMAFAGIILNDININALDVIGNIEAMSEANRIVQVAVIRMWEMIRTIVEDENIIKLVDHNSNYMWRPGVNSNQIADKL